MGFSMVGFTSVHPPTVESLPAHLVPGGPKWTMALPLPQPISDVPGPGAYDPGLPPKERSRPCMFKARLASDHWLHGGTGDWLRPHSFFNQGLLPASLPSDKGLGPGVTAPAPSWAFGSLHEPRDAAAPRRQRRSGRAASSSPTKRAKGRNASLPAAAEAPAEAPLLSAEPSTWLLGEKLSAGTLVPPFGSPLPPRQPPPAKPPPPPRLVAQALIGPAGGDLAFSPTAPDIPGQSAAAAAVAALRRQPMQAKLSVPPGALAAETQLSLLLDAAAFDPEGGRTRHAPASALPSCFGSGHCASHCGSAVVCGAMPSSVMVAPCECKTTPLVLRAAPRGSLCPLTFLSQSPPRSRWASPAPSRCCPTAPSHV